jgi:succinate dehydrogenase/fumarate reductase flavoprotein subunit
MQGKITKLAVDKLEPWSVLWDSEVKGFGVRRHGAEAKHYLLRYRFGGKQTFRKLVATVRRSRLTQPATRPDDYWDCSPLALIPLRNLRSLRTSPAK